MTTHLQDLSSAADAMNTAGSIAPTLTTDDDVRVYTDPRAQIFEPTGVLGGPDLTDPLLPRKIETSGADFATAAAEILAGKGAHLRSGDTDKRAQRVAIYKAGGTVYVVARLVP